MRDDKEKVMVGTGYLVFDDGYGYEVGQRGIIPHTFTLIEENQDIDIQRIEEHQVMTTHGEEVNKINQIIKAIKKLDRQINNK